VLSIDWEITEECLTSLIAETELLMPKYENDRPAHALLRMLKALGKYIRTNKAQAHMEAIKRVMSVYASLEKLASDPHLKDQQKKRIVAKEIQAFKKLKEQIQIDRVTKSSVAVPTSATPPVSESKTGSTPELEQVMRAVEERIKAQVSDLKSQIAAMQKELDALRKK
jgi:hypothetical protein